MDIVEFHLHINCTLKKLRQSIYKEIYIICLLDNIQSQYIFLYCNETQLENTMEGFSFIMLMENIISLARNFIRNIKTCITELQNCAYAPKMTFISGKI